MKIWRIYAAGLIIEYLVCLAISFYANDKDQYWYAFLIMLGIWAAQVVLWFKTFIVGTINYHLVAKSQMIALVEEKMLEADMPYYDPKLYADAEDYFQDVLADEQSTREQIIFAAGAAGEISASRGQGFVVGWRVMKVYKTAILNYLKKRGAWERKQQRQRREPEFS